MDILDHPNPDDLDIFEENDEIILDENNNQDASYVSEEDEDFILNESELNPMKASMIHRKKMKTMSLLIKMVNEALVGALKTKKKKMTKQKMMMKKLIVKLLKK